MKQITETSFQQGYFKIPRTLLKQQTGSGQLENMGAFFQVLSHANYSETTYNIHGLTIFLPTWRITYQQPALEYFIWMDPV